MGKSSSSIVEVLGEGEYGEVYSLKDGRACKKFFDKVSFYGIDQSTLREIAGLKLMQKYDGVMKLDTIEYGSKSVKMYMKKYPHDLHTFIDIKRLDEPQIIDIMYRLILVTYYMEKNKLLHRDIKPGNILIDENNKAVLCDWGLCRYIKSNKPIQLTNPVQTIGHRAPEIILKKKKYGIEIDMWSIGIILYELISDETFCPSSHWRTNINAIFNVLGLPSRKELPELYKTKLYKQCSKYKGKEQNLSEIFPKTDRNILDLLKQLLTFDSKKRIKPIDALNHPLFNSYNTKLDDFNIWDKLLLNECVIKYNVQSDKIPLFNWVVSKYSNKNCETIFLTMRLYNEYVEKNKGGKLQILTCLYIASKVYDLYVIKLRNIIAKEQFSAKDVIKMEKCILEFYDYNIFKPTEYNYFESYVLDNNIKFSAVQYQIASYLLLLTIIHDFTKYKINDLIDSIVSMSKNKKITNNKITFKLEKIHKDYSKQYDDIYQLTRYKKKIKRLKWKLE